MQKVPVTNAHHTVRPCSAAEAAAMIEQLCGHVPHGTIPSRSGTFVELAPKNMPGTLPLVLFNVNGSLFYARCTERQAGPIPTTTNPEKP